MLENILEIDEVDEKILQILKENSKEKLINIAKRLNIPVSTVHNRIKRLEKDKIINKYTISLNYKKLGLSITALILVKYNPDSGISQKDLLSTLSKFKYVEKGFIITGEWDILLITRFRSMDELSNFILQKLRNIKGVKETYTMVALEES